MPEQVVVIWREDPGQLINTIAENKRPRLFNETDQDVRGLSVLSDTDAEEVIQKDTFDRVAVTETFARSVLGWNV